ncbi:MAG: DUF3047 domain-containing protein [Burkholderiales bacterium]|nr:DUF3047 domain-containing protein [Burkholderiales bacterium]
MQRRSLLLGLPALAACAARPPAVETDALDALDAWHPVPLPGKRHSAYREVMKGGRSAIEAVADRSASAWRRRLRVEPAQLGRLRFAWWVERLLPGAHVGDIEREDAVARVLLGFEGDEARLSGRSRAMFDLAQLLTGERPPYATLMYVWDGHAPPETVITNPRSERLRKIVVDSGAARLGRWVEHERDVAADFERAFGELPGALVSLAVMTDADNTGAKARAWYQLPELSSGS